MEDQNEPFLMVEVGPEGLRRVVVDYDEGDDVAGFDLVRRALPALRRLDKELRRGRRP